MARSLADIDKVYGRLNTYASVSERLIYCTKMMRRTEKFVAVNSEHLTEHIRTRSGDIIEAVKTEIKILETQNN